MNKDHRQTISICLLVLGVYCLVCLVELDSMFHGLVAALCMVFAAVSAKEGKSENAEEK